MNNFKAISFKLASMFMFTVLALFVRHLSQTFPWGQIAFTRAFLGLIPVLVFYAWRRELSGALKTRRIGGHIVRGSIAAFGTFCFIGAYARLPVVDVTTITFLSPLITVVFAALFLKERVYIYRWTAVIIGFSGVLLMLVPHMETTNQDFSTAALIGIGLALLNAVAAAGATTQIRRLQETESTAAIVLYFSMFVSVIGLLTLPFGWRMPQTGDEVMALVGLGLVGGVGQIFHPAGYRYASPSLLAPFEYTAMIWALVLGYAVFGEVPTVWVVAGALVVIAAGLFVIFRERQLGLKALRESPFAPGPAEADTTEVKKP
jgi:drug/metabolite transporter (DMT)-like permease